MTFPSVSIIIPVFNVSDYIERCLISLSSQTFRDFELVIVDDHSPDDSIDKAEVFLSKSSLRWKIIRREKNGGLSAARNSGIQEANGEWVLFLDSDDELPPTALETLMEPIKNADVDCVVGNYMTIYSDYKEVSRRYSQSVTYRTNKDILSAYSQGDIPVMACNKLLRKDFLFNYRLFFKEGMLNEDELWTLMLLSKTQTVVLTGVVSYHYYVRSGSIMTTSLERNAISSVVAFNEVKSFLQLSHMRMPHCWLEHFWLTTVRKVLGLNVSSSYEKEIYNNIHTTIPYQLAKLIVRLIALIKR